MQFIKQSCAPNLVLSWSEWHRHAPLYNFLQFDYPGLFQMSHFFVLVYGCAFMLREWAAIIRFQGLWQQRSVRKPNTLQLRQCTKADTHVCTHRSKYTHIQWHNSQWKGQFIKLPAKPGLRMVSASTGLETGGGMN